MWNYKISATSLYKFITIIFVFILSFFVSKRGREVDNDYQAYEYMFEEYKSFSVEPLYKIISMIVQGLNADFSTLLFIFCFASVLLKIYTLLLAKENKKISNEGLFYFLLFYFFCFFALWDLTQIRASLSISFLMLSFFVFSPYKSIFFKLLALLSHYSISFVLVFEFIYNLANRNIIIHFLLTTIFCIFLLFLIGFTPYAIYDSSNYTESFSPISFKNLFIFFTFFMITVFYKNNSICFYLVKKFSVLSVSLLIMYYIFGLKYPSIAIRVADLSLFFSLMSLTFIRKNSIMLVYKYITLIILSIYFTYIFYMSDEPVIRLSEWGVK